MAITIDGNSSPSTSVTIAARLFGGGAPATGEPAKLTLHATQVEVRSADLTRSAPIESLRAREIGTGKSGIELAWDTTDGICAVHVTDAVALASLRSHAALMAAPQLQRLRAHRQRTTIGRTLGWVAVGVFICLPMLLLLVFFWQSDRIAAAAAARIPIDQEVQLGEKAFANMRESLQLQDSGPEYAALQTLGTRLTRGSKYKYRFHVAKNDVINAFAVPGGIIVVHTGLIQATRRPEELAGVLAHEIQHVEQRHALQAMVKELGLRGLWALTTGDVGGTVLGQTALQLTSLTFSRHAEAQADARGFDTLVANNIDPSGMADFFAIMRKQEGDAPPPFLSTHPASADREKTLRERRAALGGRHFEPLQLGEWPP